MTSTLPLLELTLNAQIDETHFASVLPPLPRSNKSDSAGSRCDRWGHPYPNRVKAVATPKRHENARRKKQRGNNRLWNT